MSPDPAPLTRFLLSIFLMSIPGHISAPGLLAPSSSMAISISSPSLLTLFSSLSSAGVTAVRQVRWGDSVIVSSGALIVQSLIVQSDICMSVYYVFVLRDSVSTVSRCVCVNEYSAGVCVCVQCVQSVQCSDGCWSLIHTIFLNLTCRII